MDEFDGRVRDWKKVVTTFSSASPSTTRLPLTVSGHLTKVFQDNLVFICPKEPWPVSPDAQLTWTWFGVAYFHS